MSRTLVIQSHRSPLPYPWLERCLNSVHDWCARNNFEYRFINDELFDLVPDELLKKLETQQVILSDLARLILLRNSLNGGYDTVVWLDADFLIFNPDDFVLPLESCAVGREVWVQHDKNDQLKVYKKVHNALLMFRLGNSFLDFYLETAERLLRQNQGGVPPQFIGPKLLTALHNIARLPVMETAGMLSPLVIRDIVQGSGRALQEFLANSSSPVFGANLCQSSCDKQELRSDEMEKCIDVLLDSGLSTAKDNLRCKEE